MGWTNRSYGKGQGVQGRLVKEEPAVCLHAKHSLESIVFQIDFFPHPCRDVCNKDPKSFNTLSQKLSKEKILKHKWDIDPSLLSEFKI